MYNWYMIKPINWFFYGVMWALWHIQILLTIIVCCVSAEKDNIAYSMPELPHGGCTCTS